MKRSTKVSTPPDNLERIKPLPSPAHPPRPPKSKLKNTQDAVSKTSEPQFRQTVAHHKKAEKMRNPSSVAKLKLEANVPDPSAHPNPRSPQPRDQQVPLATRRISDDPIRLNGQQGRCEEEGEGDVAGHAFWDGIQ